jgi:hypothetical protein
MKAGRMFLSLIPWVAFTVIVDRRGVDGVAFAAIAATVISLYFLIKNAADDGFKIIDVVGTATFGVLAVVALVGGSTVHEDAADFGRGGAALLLGVVMLASVFVLPFTEQYARPSVPREYWTSPQFRQINQKISAVWGGAVLLMGMGHVLSGIVSPVSDGTALSGASLLLNWIIPVLLILGAVSYTKAASQRASTADRPEAQTAQVTR